MAAYPRQLMPRTSRIRLLQPPYHPLFVHFPIALYFLGVLMTLGYLWRRGNHTHRIDYERFAYWSFLLSWLAALVASLVGLVDRGMLDYDDPRQQALDQHITQAIFFIILNGLVLYSRFRWPRVLDSPKRWLYLGLIGLGIAAITATGWLGGKLVYELHVGIR